VNYATDCSLDNAECIHQDMHICMHTQTDEQVEDIMPLGPMAHGMGGGDIKIAREGLEQSNCSQLQLQLCSSFNLE